ncbi:MAG: ATP-dependent RNA helicase HrpA [Gammaproteobacteria bacterium]
MHADEARHAALGALRDTLADCLLGDRHRLGKRAARLARELARGSAGHPGFDTRLARLEEAVARSREVRAARAALTFAEEWPAELPITTHRDALGALLARHQVVVVSGATGSGKSTQLPKLCLAAGRGIDGRIGHTQPRRIAARAVARRLAEETATAPGVLAAHCVRFDDTVAATTRVKVMTDGILLNEVHADPRLEQYDTLIIDEVHERTLNIDFLLGYLKRLLPRRPDLKLVITSATLDTDAFVRFFDDCASFDIPGRSYPVETRYRPLDDDAAQSLEDAITAALAELDAEERADVLVFLPGEREIREVARHLRGRLDSGTEVLQLFARLSAVRQARIFSPGPARRVILATNVAETSLTVPRVRHVIDSGLARVSRYSPRRKLQQLPVEPIARANADQRRGRCGREAPGVCIRLYGEADYAGRRAATEPEILRTNLAGVILRMKALGIADINHFPFLERPADRLIKDAYGVLQEIGALDEARAVTPLGRQLNAFPVDPRLARVLLAAAVHDCLAEALMIVAGLSISDPRERPHEQREAADRAHERHADKRSDFLWFVGAFPLARELQAQPLNKQLRRCRRQFLSAVRMREWVELHDQLARVARKAGLAQNAAPATYKAVHLALIAGFPSAVAEWQEDHYLGCRSTSFALHPASTLHKRGVKWILAGDIVETARPYARLAARIDPAWVDQVAGHLIKRTYDAPHWDARQGCARVTEIQRLFGLVLHADRLVELARVDAAQARELFIDGALVDGAFAVDDTPLPEFLAHNRTLIARVQALEARARRRDLVAPRERLRDFYAQRLPVDVCTRRALRRWLRGTPQRAEALFMSEADATSEHLVSVPEYLFPDTLDVAGTPCPLTYRFEPGDARDGVSVRVPLVLLPRLEPRHVDRLVPGLLSEKIEQLLRNLPKRERRRFSPLRQFAMAATEAVGEADGALADALASALAQMIGGTVARELFDEQRLPAHLRMRIELVDADGEVVAAGRDLAALRAGRGEVAAAAAERVDWGLAGRSQGEWLFGTLPPTVEATVGAARVRGYPALVDCGDAVELGVFDRPGQAAHAHREGLARLLLLAASRERRYLERGIADSGEIALLAALFGYRGAPHGYLAEGVARRWARTHADVRDAAAWEALSAAFSAALVAEVGAAAQRLHALFRRGAALRRQLDQERHAIPAAAREDIDSQLAQLLGPAVVARIVTDGAPRHDRYLDAIERRIERVGANPGKDLKKLEQLAPLWQRFLACAPAEGGDDALAELRSLLEEYRISLFAPELGTARKVSADQLALQLDLLEGGD